MGPENPFSSRQQFEDAEKQKQVAIDVAHEEALGINKQIDEAEQKARELKGGGESVSAEKKAEAGETAQEAKAEKVEQSPESENKNEVKQEGEENVEENLKKAKEVEQKALFDIIAKRGELVRRADTMEEARRYGKQNFGLNPWREGSSPHKLHEEVYKGIQESKFGGQNTWKGIFADTASLGITAIIRRYKFNKKYNERLSAIKDERSKLEKEGTKAEEKLYERSSLFR